MTMTTTNEFEYTDLLMSEVEFERVINIYMDGFFLFSKMTPFWIRLLGFLKRSFSANSNRCSVPK